MSNVLSDEKRQQVVALGRLGWSLRRIEGSTGVRRETASDKAAGVPVRALGGRPRAWPPKPATAATVSTDALPKPATTGEVSTDGVAAVDTPGRAPTASACEPYRELIAEALRQGRLGDTAAVTALLDRLLHHAHIVKCSPRSWRTKVPPGLASRGWHAVKLDPSRPPSWWPVLTCQLVAGFQVSTEVLAYAGGPVAVVPRQQPSHVDGRTVPARQGLSSTCARS